MMLKSKIFLTLIFLGISFFYPLSKTDAAISITAAGGWTQTIDAVNLTAGAGSDLNSTYTSLNNATIIDIGGAGNNNWRVDVRKTDATWDGNFHIFVRRTGDGSGPGPGTISGGTSFMEVTAIDTQFFSGSRNRSNVPVAYQLQGVSLNIGPNTYNTSVTFTVTQLP